jgi:aminomethyltransferase
LKHGGKVVPFGGYSMPLSYSSLGQVASHHHTRNSASLFDVSHMVQHHFEGPGAGGFLEWLTPTSVKKLGDHQGSLSLLLNFGGGILDDLIITRINDAKYYVVTNAGRRSEDLAWIAERLAEWREQGKGEVKHTVLEDQGLIALQGPKAAEALAKHTDVDLSKLTFGKSVYATVAGAPDCHIVRGGYTGEDGFEISVSPEQTEQVSEALLAEEAVELAGLAARDSLRLEAGMCLYGNDLDETVGPAEGGLTWVVGEYRT